MRIVYSDGYFLQLGDHVFPAAKYRRVKDQLVELGVIAPGDVIEPEPATDEEVLLVHAPSYVGKLRTGLFSSLEAVRHEVPYSRDLVGAFYLAAGGTVVKIHAEFFLMCFAPGWRTEYKWGGKA